MKLAINFTRAIVPKSLYVVKYSRSSGPGGQHVNKTSSKATVIFLPQFLDWIPDFVKLQLTQKNYRYFNKNKDKIIISSELTRSREDNTEDCFKKLDTSIKSIVYEEKPVDEKWHRKWEHVRRKENERRIEEKKRNGGKKSSRRVSLSDF